MPGVEGIEVELPNALSRFELPAPPTGAKLKRAIRASLRLLDLAPDTVTFPLHAAIWLAILEDDT